MLKEKTEMNRDTTEKNLKKMIGDMESSIISAHKKYFGDNLEFQAITPEQSLLYGTVLRYFTGKS